MAGGDGDAASTPTTARNIPIPVSVKLFNLFSNQRGKNKATNAKFRSEHSLSLLCPVELQIILEGNDEPVYSSRCSYSVHPKWYLIDEIDLFGPSWRLEQERLYPSLILRIVAIEDDGNDDEQRRPPEIITEFPLFPSEMNRLDSVPEAMPANACVVRYSDGCDRTTPSVFNTLVEHNLAHESPAHEDFTRFEDDVFLTLDNVPAQPNRERIVSVSSLLGHSTFPAYVEESINARQTSTSSERLDKLDEAGTPFDKDQRTVMLDDLELEEERLMKILAEEEEKDESNKATLSETEVIMNGLINMATKVGDETELIEQQIQKYSDDVRHTNWLLSLQRIKLIKDLRQIYPISVEGDKSSQGHTAGGEATRTNEKCFIRNLHLPINLLASASQEEEISAALGYTCHLIIMMAKYLSIPLRHRVMFNSSRSGIQECGTVYPLFVTRLVERDQLLRGVSFLNANVDCILLHLNLQSERGVNMLKKLNKVYEHFATIG